MIIIFLLPEILLTPQKVSNCLVNSIADLEAENKTKWRKIHSVSFFWLSSVYRLNKIHYLSFQLSALILHSLCNEHKCYISIYIKCILNYCLDQPKREKIQIENNFSSSVTENNEVIRKVFANGATGTPAISSQQQASTEKWKQWKFISNLLPSSCVDFLFRSISNICIHLIFRTQMCNANCWKYKSVLGT